MPAPLSADDEAIAAARERSRALALHWRAGPAYARAEALFAPLAHAPAEAVAAAAMRLLADGEWVPALLAPLIAALAADPWIEPPLRVNRDALRCGAILFDGPAISITASVLSASALAALPTPASIVVPGRMSVVRYHRGGGARLHLWRADRADADFAAAMAARCVPVGTVRLADGLVRRIDGRTHAQLIEGAASDVVTITATVRAGAAPVMREYDRADGRLLRAAALDDAGARTAMLATLLRHLGHADADAFDSASRDPAPFVRWDVMREWLALDVEGALPRLREMTADPQAEVRIAAQAMLPRAEAAIACRR